MVSSSGLGEGGIRVGFVTPPTRRGEWIRKELCRFSSRIPSIPCDLGDDQTIPADVTVCVSSSMACDPNFTRLDLGLTDNLLAKAFYFKP